MTLNRRAVLAAPLLALVAGCAQPTKFRKYSGPQVTRIVVYKAKRKMYLISGNVAIRTYDIDLGFRPTGDKVVAGDGGTPEGHYIIDRRNPNSRYHLSLGISYPNERDIAKARALGQDPGGDIFIHGTPTGTRVLTPDWTWGCIAVENEEIEEIYAMVRDGTPITIYG